MSTITHLAVRITFDRGFAGRPPAFYARLDLRDWLDALDWHYAEFSDLLYKLEAKESSSKEIERVRDILRMLEDEIREADTDYSRLALGQR